ncbi:MAG: M48 family metalloprotease [Candidatus Thorarchaeota archaeon]|nr:M48 family metalloprotease [Candidatus Thorarchaeota archaeon]
MSVPQLVTQVEQDKWRALLAFAIVDLLQIVFVSFLYLDTTSLFIVGFDFTRTNTFVSVTLFIAISLVQVILLYYTALGTLAKESMMELFPHATEKTKWSCKYSREQIVKWTREIAQQSQIEVKKIYLLQSPIPNAFTFSLPLIGSIVVIHSNLINLLNPDEVKAIISHEIAHIRNKDSIVQILARTPDFFIHIIYLYVYIRIGLGIIDALLVTFDPIAVAARLVALIIFIIMSRIFISIGTRFIQRASRAAEHLADYHAATLVGATVTVNALLRLGQRMEAITALANEIKWLASLNDSNIMPLTETEMNRTIHALSQLELDDKTARREAPRIFLENRLRLLRDVYGLNLSDEQIEDAIAPAVKKLVEQHSKAELASQGTTVDWRRADLDGNERLDTDELTQLVALLRKNPSKLMFDNEVGRNFLVLDHPDFRQRVLFIADALGI